MTHSWRCFMVAADVACRVGAEVTAVMLPTTEDLQRLFNNNDPLLGWCVFDVSVAN